MDESPHLNSHIAQTLLGTEISSMFSNEEKLHPWHANRCQPFTQPFLRLWDCYSGSQPDSEGRMLARAPRHRLDTAESRRYSLTTHINHGIWEPTPYISFTTSPAAVEDLAELRARRGNRGSQTLTVLDPNIRLKLGLPILDVAAEMDHYEILDPYGKSNRYYVNHYACLWEVTEGEVVGHWQWDEINKTENWHQNIIIPALMESRKVALQDTFDLSAAIGSLSRKFSLMMRYFDAETLQSQINLPIWLMKNIQTRRVKLMTVSLKL